MNMASADSISQNGPFKYDVYVGFSVPDLRTMQHLQEKLAQRDVMCYPKYSADCLAQLVKVAIDEGVARSRKCLLYVSQSFIGEQSYEYEVACVLKKVERFSRDMLIVLQDPQLAVLPPKFSEYRSLTLPEEGTWETSRFLEILAAELKRGYVSVMLLRKIDTLNFQVSVGFVRFEDACCIVWLYEECG